MAPQPKAKPKSKPPKLPEGDPALVSVPDEVTHAEDDAGMSTVEDQAMGFRQVREARRNELVEDYVELIADLIDSGGEARPVDIAARLGVTKPTVNKMLKRLQQDDLITQRPYRAVFLTDAGRALAEESRRRHQIVESFLISIGVSADTARADAEGMEHHVSEETLGVFERLAAGSIIGHCRDKT